MDIHDEIIADLDDAREKMTALIASLNPVEEVYPGWTEKELLAHITGWDDLIINTLNRHLCGQAPVVSINRGIDFYNSTTVAERENLTLEHVKREYRETRDALKDLLRSIPTEVFDQVIITPWGPRGTVKEFIQVFSHHEREHEEEIRKSLLKKGEAS